jgi:hypothetical protein
LYFFLSIKSLNSNAEAKAKKGEGKRGNWKRADHRTENYPDFIDFLFSPSFHYYCSLAFACTCIHFIICVCVSVFLSYGKNIKIMVIFGITLEWL